jgi:alkylation response protein AidB-like acyl-CoA dehydrogenase
MTTDVEAFRSAAHDWLASRLEPRSVAEADGGWGRGVHDVSVFHDITADEERALLDRAMQWQQVKCDAGYGAITWPCEFGGAGLSPRHEEAFREEEEGFVTPRPHETTSVTARLIAPTVRIYGTEDQQHRWVRRFLRTDELCCQLFSEPGAGSDLAGLATRAVTDGDQWMVNGQKVWSSGARFAEWGMLVARTDPDVPKHAGLTTYIIPMDLRGVEVRPIRQMSGGWSFNEVFLEDVRVDDRYRVGAVGDGWRVALTTLGLERGAADQRVGGGMDQALALARWLGCTADRVLRDRLADLYVNEQITALVHEHMAKAVAAGHDPGAQGSIAKLRWTQDLARTSDVVSLLLGPRLVADTGEWGTFSWTAHVLGAPGYRIAGGSDEIQRNILGERVLGLPAEPRVDRNMAWRDVPRGLSTGAMATRQ